MSERLRIIACSSFEPELRHCIETGSYTDVEVESYDSNCLASHGLTDTIRAIVQRDTSTTSVWLGSSCAQKADEDLSDLIVAGRLKIVQLKQCFEFFLNPETIHHLIRNRSLLVSNGWLQTLDHRIAQWGFDPDTAKSFFSESARKITLLDTGLPGDIQQQLTTLSDYVGLPYEILPVGMTTCAQLLERHVQEWRDRIEQNAITRRLSELSSKFADFSFSIDQLDPLLQSTDEAEVVRKLRNMFSMFFAPKSITYTPIHESTARNEQHNGPVSGNTFVNDHDRLTIVLSHREELIGEFVLDQVAFPQFMNRYQDTAELLGRVAALAISNTRKFEAMNEKQALLNTAAEELRHVIATKDRFFSIIAHDLRSPLTGLIGLTELLSTGDINAEDSDGLREVGALLHNSATDLYDLLENLLKWSMSQGGFLQVSMQQIELAPIVDHIIAVMQLTAEQKGISLRSEVSSGTSLRADADLISTILRNLVSNAIKFTQRDGTVTIRSADDGDEYLDVSVSDTGIGMSPDILEKLFVIEEKTQRPGTSGESGTGLGLLVCKEFAEKLQGSIRVESVAGMGTTFTVRLHKWHS